MIFLKCGFKNILLFAEDDLNNKHLIPVKSKYNF